MSQSQHIHNVVVDLEEDIAQATHSFTPLSRLHMRSYNAIVDLDELHHLNSVSPYHPAHTYNAIVDLNEPPTEPCIPLRPHPTNISYNAIVDLDEPHHLSESTVAEVGSKYGLNMQKAQLDGLQRIYSAYLESVIPR